MKYRHIAAAMCFALTLNTILPAALADEAQTDIPFEEIGYDEIVSDDPVTEEPALNPEGSEDLAGLILDEDHMPEESADLETANYAANEEEMAAAQAAGQAVAEQIRNTLPETGKDTAGDVTAQDRDAIVAARAAYEALSPVAKNDYMPYKYLQKLIACEQKLAKLDQDEADARELARQINALPSPAEITLSDETEVKRLEDLRDNYKINNPSVYEKTDEAALKKLIACRDKITQLKANNATDEYINNEIAPLINSGEYAEAQQKEIEDIIQKYKDLIKALTENGNPDGSPVTQEQIDDLLNQMKDELAGVKTVHQLAAEAYEEKLKAYKTPENVVLSDKEDIAALKAEYDNLSDKTKELLDSQYIAPGESYKSRLDSLINKISALETSLSEAQKAAEHAIEYDEKIRPTYYSTSGINEDYSGVAGMIRSNDFDANGLAAIRSIRQDALNKISAEKDISKLQAIKDNAIAALKEIKNKERLQADSFEASVNQLGPVIDLSRSKAADVRALRSAYNALAPHAKKYADTDKTAAGDTYKARLEALENRIDQMAKDDAASWKNLVDSLPQPDAATLASEGAIQNARVQYDALTNEAKAKVSQDDLNKLAALEAKMILEHQKEDILNQFNDQAAKKANSATYEPAQKAEINRIIEATRAAIKNAKSAEEAEKAKNDGMAKINAVKTKAQLMKSAGVKRNFSTMKFHSTKQTKTAIYLRWEGVENIAGFQIYGAKSGEPMKMIRQYDYNARSAKITGLSKKTEYVFKIQAFQVVDGEIIPVYESFDIYATTKGGKYGSVKNVKVKKVGKKNTASKKSPKVTLKQGKTAKIKIKEEKTSSKLKRRRKTQFESTNTKVATVSGSGTITAHSPGTAYIICYSQSGKYRTIKVTVK